MVKSLHSRQYTIFRDLLAQAREDIGMTQVQVATKLGKPQSYVSKYESGDRRLDVTEFVQIADILSLDISGFLDQYRAKAGTFNSPI
jgi:transcriptional regulator with XRE-family HTH domain